MPDIAALWPDGEGGLTGARARKRLAAADPPVTTVEQLRELAAEDILAIPRASKGVLAEVRRALNANGLSLALEQPPSPARQREAREAGQAEAQRARKRTSAGREDAPEASAADFAVLVAELRAELAEADPERLRRIFASPPLETPAAFRNRPWAWALVGPAGASALTGYSAASIRAYKSRAERERTAGNASERTMPPLRDGKWVTGELALWIATRNEGQAGGIKLTDADAEAIRAEVEAARIPGRKRSVPNGVYSELAARYGVHVSLVKDIVYGLEPAQGRAGTLGHRAERRESVLLVQTRAAAAAILERGEPMTFSGLARELGVDYRTAVGRAAMAGIESDLAQEHADDSAVAAFLSARLAETRRYLSFAALTEALHEAGMPALATQVRRLLPGLRAAERTRIHRPVGAGRARGESLHPRGWLYASQVAEDWGVRPGAITEAIRRGYIHVEERSHGRAWIDPARLRARKDGWRTPVDVDCRFAALRPGDPGYEN
jgi:hypothetical protein